MDVSIIGAGVAGLSCACELLDRGVSVIVYEKSECLGDSACSWFAGGMLAPWCEAESADRRVVELGLASQRWWGSHIDGLQQRGSLVLSMQRDSGEIERFSRLTECHRQVNRSQISSLEPDLADRFERGLYFESEAHLDPRLALRQLANYLIRHGGKLLFGKAIRAQECNSDFVIDCRGFAASDQLNQIRGVKGEMLILKTSDLSLSRPVRLLHPRYPIYIVPRGDGHFMLGATMIENDERNRVSVRSMLELLSAAFALHPGFGEAEIVEIGVDVRPAYDDNFPALYRRDNVVYVNGLFRHGFLLGPAMAMQVGDAILDQATFDGLKQCA